MKHPTLDPLYRASKKHRLILSKQELNARWKPYLPNTSNKFVGRPTHHTLLKEEQKIAYPLTAARTTGSNFFRTRSSTLPIHKKHILPVVNSSRDALCPREDKNEKRKSEKTVNLDMGSIAARRLVPPAKGMLPSSSLDILSSQLRLSRRKDTKKCLLTPPENHMKNSCSPPVFSQIKTFCLSGSTIERNLQSIHTPIPG